MDALSKSRNVLANFADAESDVNLTHVLSQYQAHLNKVHEILLQMHAIHDENPWAFNPVCTTLHGKCGDGNEVTHEYKGQQALFQSSESARLKQILDKHRGDINPALYRYLFEAKMARITTQALIDDTLWSLQSRPQLRMNAGQIQPEQQQQQDLVVIRRLLYSLFAAERRYSHETTLQHTKGTAEDIETEEVSAFVKDVRTWILHVSAAYLRLAPLHGRIVLLLHLLGSPGTTQWAAPLIQYTYRPDEHHWSVFMNEYIVMLCILFDSSLHKHLKPQWNEDDYLVALDQLAIVHDFDTLSAAVLGQRDSNQSLFIFADQLVAVLNIGIKTFADQQYTNAMKRLAQVICQIAQVLADRMSANDERKEQEKQYLDDFLIKVIDGYLQIQEAKVWHFLPALPFRAVSIRALWKIALSLLDIDSYIEPQDLQHTLDNLPDITKILAFLEQSQIQGVFLLGCLSNVITSIPIPSADPDAEDTENREIASCLIAVVANTLFTTAFVDDNLREIYYKDVRDSFGSICTSQPFTISLLLRWTVSNFDTMEGMAVYLFRSLPLSRWKVLQSDLILLHELLAEGATVPGSAKTGFARYVIEHLNYGYDEKEDPAVSISQPWHSRKLPFLPYGVHEELAFMLLDVLQLHNPLPDADKNAHLIRAVGASVSAYLPTKTQQLLSSAAARVASPGTKVTEAQNVVTEWSWKIALQLKLYDCALSERAPEIENSITGAFLKDMLHGHPDPTASHGALLVYISFLLSPTSRHFLRFESANGWDKLLLILRRGRPEAVVQILADIIPTFVYMHGDDFFNDENVLNFLRQMVDFKADPMLAHAVSGWMPGSKTLFTMDMDGVAMVIGSHIWHGMFIDSVDQVAGESGGFSYRDLVLHSWTKTVFRKKDWMWSDHYVSVMDCICKFAFCLRRHGLVRSMLGEEQKKLQNNRNQQASPKLGPAAGQQQHNHQRNPLRLIKNMLPDAAYTSLLAGEWSLASVTANNLFRTPGVEQNSLWFAYDVLTLETVEEESDRAIVAEACANTTSDLADMDIATVLKSQEVHVEKPVDFFSIYRWLQHVLICPADHPMMPLFLQMFFSLYYANIEKDGRRTFYGRLFFTKKQDMIEKLRDRVAYLQTYHGQQQADSKVSSSKASITSGDEDKCQSVYHEELRRVYYAMWLWLDKSDLLDPTFDIAGLPKHYCPELLLSCRSPSNTDEKSKPWQEIQLLWLDLVQYDQLSDMFSEFPWIGSDKFRPIAKEYAASEQSIKQYTVHKPQTLLAPDLQLMKPAQILSSTELLSSSPELLMGSTVETLSQHAKRFYEHLEQQRKLDVAYIEKLATLYVNKSGSKHVEAPCSKRCKKPAEWDIIASYTQKDDAVASKLEDNRKEAARFVFRSVDARICIQALLAFRKFDAIVDQASQGKRQNTALVQLGWLCLQYVLKHLSYDTKNFPPSRIVVLHMSQVLGKAIADDAQYVDKFFNLIAEDTGDNGEQRIQLLYPMLKPHSDNKHLPSTIERVLRYSSDSQLHLLPLFDMALWAKSSYASDSARTTVYNLLFTHLKTAIIKSDETLYTQYCNLVLSLMDSGGAKSKKPEQAKVLEYVLKLLADTAQYSSAQGRPAVVDAFAAKTKGSEKINGDALVVMVTLLGNTFSKANHLFATYANAVPALCRLLQNIFDGTRLAETQKDGPALIWRHLGLCFHAWWRNADDRSQQNQYTNVFAQQYSQVLRNALGYFDPPGRARLLNWIFGYYHERLLQLPGSEEDAWMEHFGNTIAGLNWGCLDLSPGHLRRIHQTWSSLRQQDLHQHRRPIYVRFIWKVLLSWIIAHPQPSIDPQQRCEYVQVAFMFVQDGESVWPEDKKERKRALDQLWNTFCHNHTSLSVEQVSSIVNSLRRHWDTPLPLPSAASNDSFLSILIDWVRRLTCFNETQVSMKRRRLFSDFILKLLPDDTDMQRAWTQHMYQVVNEHAPRETEGPEFEETVTLFSNMLPIVYEIPPGGNACMLSAVFGALARPAATPAIIELMENTLEQNVIISASSPNWCRLGELLSRSNPDYSLFLQYCLDHSAFLTMRVYGEAKLQQECARQDSVKLANLAEEVAAIISIAKVDRKSAVHLVKFFAILFCRSRQQEARLIASIVSLSRTASRWVNAHQHSPKPDLGNEWHVFVTLLDGFLASRLIARGVLSPAPASADWVKRIELMRADKKYKPFTQVLGKGIEITRDSDRWTIWQLDQVVTEFARTLQL
ncbi:hypothetical protein BDB00DRAFT_801170 [Zychaea mexicana]|uniref:uncharacterized protein n=1 Tax=Zychaea mexicana TaxID=64656 RepID=UPI0022FE1010|nr:uncharacterized protein BDB00DRAFT_801170 [Zychaea mexicana]KAI9498113.1 hypothetical protein BDB00DRAFT_801170 [Zychaea mexicana]